ncbi:MAG: MATE family efflux transporter [Lachnospiraceae bacterium]|nr:MAG: MATE family efflux transporter [Lachnospiraceae bacterium]
METRNQAKEVGNTDGNNREIFEDMSIPKALATMAVPTIIGQMVVLIYNLADTFFIGRTGNPYMIGAASLVLPIFNLSNSISNFVGVGSGTLVSRLLGVHKDKDASKVSAFAFYLAIIVSAIFSLCIFIFMDPLLKALGSSSQTHVFARQYAFCVVVLGGIPTITQLTLAQLLRAVGCSKQAGFGMSMGGILNVFLDPLFMFVILPEGNEVLGAGIATMLSNTAALIYFIITVAHYSHTTVLRLSPHGLPNKEQIKGIISVGAPACLSNFLFDLSQMMINRLMSGYGDIALAAIGIELKAERLPLNAGIGIAQAMLPIAAYNHSSGNYKRMRGIINFSRFVGIVIGIGSVVLYEICAKQIIGIFINEPQTISYGTSFIRIRCLATTFMFISFHYVYVFQAMGCGGRALFCAVMRQLFFNIPFMLIFNPIFGMYGLVWAEFAADVLTVFFSWLLYRSYDRKALQPLEKKRAQSL